MFSYKFHMQRVFPQSESVYVILNWKDGNFFYKSHIHRVFPKSDYIFGALNWKK